MQYEDLTELIIGSAFTVHRKMGFGFLESVYEKCMEIELCKHGLKVERQCPVVVRYDDEPVGEFFADLLVEEKIIVELKSVRSVATAHEVQLVNYLTATGKDIGLLINFGEKSATVKRKVRSLSPGSLG